MIAALLLFACTPTPSINDGEESHEWQGWVYADLPGDADEGLNLGAVRLWDMDGNLVSEGEQPDDDRPGVWRFQLEEAVDAEIRISGPDQVTTVWRTTAPDAQAYWYAGSLFAAKQSTMDDFWADLADMLGRPMGTAGKAHLLGQPLLLWGEDEAAWTGATITVYDGDGTVHPAIALSQDESGLLLPSELTDGPIATFAAPDLTPGPIRLVVDSSDGRNVVMDYNAGPGELLSAFAFTLPEPQ
jgi:hypothetical protein